MPVYGSSAVVVAETFDLFDALYQGFADWKDEL
jgi:hypothetical protein